MKLVRNIFIYIFLFCSYIYSIDLTNDNSDDIKLRIKKYNDNKVYIYHKQYLERKEEKAQKQFYGDEVLYTLYRGNGKKIKLSQLVYEMGNIGLYEKIKYGENFYGFSAGLTLTVIFGAALDVIGAAFLLSTGNIYINKPINLENNYLFLTGTILLSTSIIPIIGIFIFSYLIYKANPYKMNIIQARTIVNQYNEFLKKKYNIPLDLDISYNLNNIINFNLKIKL